MSNNLRAAFTRGVNKYLARDMVMKMVDEHNKQFIGLRKGWRVKAADLVKKWHVDRGDVKVGLYDTKARYHIIDSLRPRYMVPDMTGCELRPYVTEYGSSASDSATTAAPGIEANTTANKSVAVAPEAPGAEGASTVPSPPTAPRSTA